MSEQAESTPAADWIADVLREHDRLKRQLPQIDPDELLNILYSVMRPFGSGRRFLLRRGDGPGYVF